MSDLLQHLTTGDSTTAPLSPRPVSRFEPLVAAPSGGFDLGPREAEAPLETAAEVEAGQPASQSPAGPHALGESAASVNPPLYARPSRRMTPSPTSSPLRDGSTPPQFDIGPDVPHGLRSIDGSNPPASDASEAQAPSTTGDAVARLRAELLAEWKSLSTRVDHRLRNSSAGSTIPAAERSEADMRRPPAMAGREHTGSTSMPSSGESADDVHSARRPVQPPSPALMENASDAPNSRPADHTELATPRSQRPSLAPLPNIVVEAEPAPTTPSAPTVRISIGSIRVRGAAPSSARSGVSERPPRSPVLGLEEYLSLRRSGGLR